MNGTPEELATDVTFPDRFSTGATVLLASAGDPAKYAVDLHALCQYGNASDRALVVTTTESATETMAAFDRVCPESKRPSLGFVDTTSNQPSVSAIYDETPIILTPSPGDLERLVVALADLSEEKPPAQGERHLAIRSLTPILQSTSTTHVCAVLERIGGLRSGGGLCLFGLDYTAHDEETIEAVSQHVDAVLWITRDASDTIQLDYRPARGSSVRPLHHRNTGK